MPDMTIKEMDRLEFIFKVANSHSEKLNTWEKSFIKDNQKRYEDDDGGEYGDHYFVSPKMWTIFAKIENKLVGAL